MFLEYNERPIRVGVKDTKIWVRTLLLTGFP